jgi:hypothetical protein
VFPALGREQLSRNDRPLVVAEADRALTVGAVRHPGSSRAIVVKLSAVDGGPLRKPGECVRDASGSKRRSSALPETMADRYTYRLTG